MWRARRSRAISAFRSSITSAPWYAGSTTHSSEDSDASLWQPDKTLWAGSQDADEHYYMLDSTEERRQHDAPFVDRTAYTGWNALAASAYWAAWAATGDDAFETRAHEAMGAIARTLW